LDCQPNDVNSTVPYTYRGRKVSRNGEQHKRGEVLSRAPGGHRSSGQRRGEALRRHILIAAKDVFLTTGFERASMDTVAARAGTSKRSLYAHFETKDKLFDAVLNLVRELYLGTLQTPDAYVENPAHTTEAVTRFCGRYLQLMTWESQVRTCRLSISEAERLPDSSRAYFDAIFTSTYDRLASYLTEHYATHGIDGAAGAALAQDLLNQTVLPGVFQTLLGVRDAIKGAEPPSEANLAIDVDLDLIRARVSKVLPA
jgi:AcrR family transcriptional regulator